MSQSDADTRLFEQLLGQAANSVLAGFFSGFFSETFHDEFDVS